METPLPPKKTKKRIATVLVAGLFAGAAIIFYLESKSYKVSDFASCVAYGYTVTGTSPQVCTAAGKSYNGPFVSKPTPTSQPVPYQTVGAFSGAGKYPEKNDIIDDAVAWKAYWEAVHSEVKLKPLLPAVDFNRKTVVGISEGPHQSEAVGIEFLSVMSFPDKTVVTAAMIKPGETCHAESGTLDPASMIAFDTPETPIVFDIKIRTRQCR